jgi:hypothetical protein
VQVPAKYADRAREIIESSGDETGG